MSDDKKTALAKINPHLPAPSPDKKSAQPRETPPVPETDAAPRDLAAVPAPDFSIVGIGASAGGLTAFESFFAGIPDDGKPGMAFVLIQHLAPNHKSMLTELISRSTKMHVFEVEDGMTIRNNCVYIIPPDRTMILEGGKLRLLKPSEPRGMRLPIDTFFKSMAQELREKALCIILSGTGSDGSNGIRAVKKQGGQVLVQNPDNITFDGMPRSALATGLADFVLAPEEMPAILMTPSRLPRHAPERPTISAEMIRESCELLHGQTGHDFSQYKKNTLIRRVERRMALHSMDRAEDYLHHLHNSPGEVQNLFRDLLIGVTSFFRDPEAFDVLQKQVIPHLFTGKPLNVPVRLWVCGCATGEEAYSMAILLREYTESIKKNFTIQIFATDIDPEGIRQARTGFYPADIAEAITPERLRRFFSKEGDGRYRVKKNIRDMLIFSEQNVTKDPPFSRIDLISCRNLLIYLSATLQKKLITLFHYALNPRGFLFLGNSETASTPGLLFSLEDRKHKIYRRQEIPGSSVNSTLCTVLPATIPIPTEQGLHVENKKNGTLNLRELTEQTLLTHYARPAVLINRYGDILHIFGRTGRYLEPTAGDAAMNIMAMAREGLRPALTNALYKVISCRKPVHLSALQVKTNGGFSTVNLTLLPAVFQNSFPISDIFLAIFDESSIQDTPKTFITNDVNGPKQEHKTESDLIKSLRHDLEDKDNYLQSILEEMNTSLEELKSANEELQSVNEELQSSNEELETSKEELQSINEELTTVNSELQGKVTELAHANNDMNNLLSGTGIATLFVDHALRIVRFTPSTTKLINLIQADINRPVGHIVTNLTGYDRLVEDLETVLLDLSPREVEVQTKTGAWFLMRMSPYRTMENVIQGAVITFTDITELRHARDLANEAQLLAKGIMENIREAVVVLDESLSALAANPAFYRMFPSCTNRLIGHDIFESCNAQWNIPPFRHMLNEVLTRHREVEDFKLVLTSENSVKRELVINARHISDKSEKGGWILLALMDASGLSTS